MNNDGSTNVSSDNSTSSSSRRKKIMIVVVSLVLVACVGAAIWLLLNSSRPIADDEANREYMQVQSRIYNDQFVQAEAVLSSIDDNSATFKIDGGSTKTYELSLDTSYQLGPDANEADKGKMTVGSEVIISYSKKTNQLQYIWQRKE